MMMDALGTKKQFHPVIIYRIHFCIDLSVDTVKDHVLDFSSWQMLERHYVRTVAINVSGFAVPWKRLHELTTCLIIVNRVVFTVGDTTVYYVTEFLALYIDKDPLELAHT